MIRHREEIMNDIKKTLKIASTLEIVLGTLHLLSLIFLLEKELLNALTPLGKGLLFGVDGLLILLGIIGLLSKQKKSLIAIILGIITIIVQMLQAFALMSSSHNFIVVFLSCILLFVTIQYIGDNIKIYKKK